MSDVYVIAEIGSNHDGELPKAKALIEEAAIAGADAAKVQCLAPLKREWLPELKSHANNHGIDFGATPFDVASVAVLDELDVPWIKIASAEIVNLQLVKAAAQTGRPLIISTGMASLAEVERALDVVSHATPCPAQPDHATPDLAPPRQVTLLQCVARYPTPPDQMNLRVMQTLRDCFDLPVGLSTHCMSTAIPIAAVALDACLVEAHLTLDRTSQGPDHPFALEPPDFRAMVQGIREVEQAMGDGRKDGPREGEMAELRGRRLAWT